MELIVALLFLIIGVPIISIYAICRISKSHHNNKIQNWHEQGIEYKISLRHIGGHPNLQQNSNVEITAKSNGTIIFTEKSTGFSNSIQANQISNCEMSNETQIQSRITATRLVTLGVFALAAKKNTTTHTYYLTLSYIQNGIDIHCLFVSFAPFGEFISSINRLRIESQKDIAKNDGITY